MHLAQGETEYRWTIQQGVYFPFQNVWYPIQSLPALFSEVNICKSEMLTNEGKVMVNSNPISQACIKSQDQQSIPLPIRVPKIKPQKKQKQGRSQHKRSAKKSKDGAKRLPKKVYQKKGRNAISSIAKNIFRRVIIMGMDRSLIQRVITSNALSITYAQFLQRAKHKKKQLEEYVNEATFIALMQHSDEVSKMKQEWALVFRVLCRHYMTGSHLTHLLNSTKIKAISRRSHFQKLRQLYELLF